jgi:hypothetical protein
MFDFAAQLSVDVRRIRELLTLSFIERKKYPFSGSTGVRKTPLAILLVIDFFNLIN